MAPKSKSTKSAAERKAEEQQRELAERWSAEWTAATAKVAEVEAPVTDGFLPEQAVSGYRVPVMERFPMLRPGELVVFVAFFHCGVVLPALGWFMKLLGYYGIQMHNLGPNSIVQVAMFVHLCEAFLRVEPHFDLWRYFYQLKPASGSGPYRVIGGCYFALREGRGAKYIELYLNTTGITWKPKWFYVQNV